MEQEDAFKEIAEAKALEEAKTIEKIKAHKKAEASGEKAEESVTK